MSTVIDFENLPSRPFANIFDRPVKGGPNTTHGVGEDSDAIGGYTGMGWYEYFEDRISGEIFRVHCSDGVNGGKGAYPDTEMPLYRACYNAVGRRTHQEVDAGVKEVRLSRNEWVIMHGHTHVRWLDGENQADTSITEGLIGHIHGVPVVVDPNKEDELPL